MYVVLDVETMCAAGWGIKNTCATVHAASPGFGVNCLAWGTEPDEIHTWDARSDDLPVGLFKYIEAGAYVIAHNAAYERAVWEQHCVPVLGWPEVPPDRWRCTMALAASVNLPLGLDRLAKAIGLEESKDLDGRKVMLTMAKRENKHKFTDEMWDQLVAYCAQDTRVEIRVLELLQRYARPQETEIWLLDQKINNRGVPVDVEAVKAIHNMVVAEQAKRSAQLEAVAGCSPKQVAKLLEYLSSHGCNLPNLRAETVSEALNHPDLSEPARFALEVRQETSQGSTGKYAAFLHNVSPDGRVRGLFQYGGASQTVRWAGKLVQLQNLPHIGLDESVADQMIDWLRDAFINKQADWIEFLFGPVMEAAKRMIRPMIYSPKGLIISDFSQIEVRVLAWCAGETELLEYLTHGKCIYKRQAAPMFGVRYEDVTKQQRKIAKPVVLGCGYGLGSESLGDYAKGMGVEMSEEDAEMSVRIYRESNPAIVRFWYSLMDSVWTALLAVHDIDKVQRVGPIIVHQVRRGREFALQLPSGRFIKYRNVEIVETERGRRAMKYDSPSEQHRATGYRVYGWHGKFVENVCQAIARDMLAEAMLRLDKESLSIIAHVHDEVILEEGQERVAEVERIMSQPPAWAPGFPLANETHFSHRYTK